MFQAVPPFGPSSTSHKQKIRLDAVLTSMVRARHPRNSRCPSRFWCASGLLFSSRHPKLGARYSTVPVKMRLFKLPSTAQISSSHSPALIFTCPHSINHYGSLHLLVTLFMSAIATPLVAGEEPSVTTLRQDLAGLDKQLTFATGLFNNFQGDIMVSWLNFLVRIGLPSNL